MRLSRQSSQLKQDGQKEGQPDRMLPDKGTHFHADDDKSMISALFHAVKNPTMVIVSPAQLHPRNSAEYASFPNDSTCQSTSTPACQFKRPHFGPSSALLTVFVPPAAHSPPAAADFYMDS